jgi:fatty-acid peroxygenase
VSDDIPSLLVPDCTIPLLREGYGYIGRQCRYFHSDIFRGRLLGQPALFVTGPEATRLFYDESRFRRADAVPALIKKTLFGEGGVQGLDDEAHRNRKGMFMSLMSKANIARFLEHAQAQWNVAASSWVGRERVVLMEEAENVLCRAALAWSGITLEPAESERIARECAALVSSFTAIGPRMWRARAARRRAESWGRDVIERVRSGALSPPDGSALRVIAAHRQLDGTLLPLDVAAVELLNIVRPITAIGRWVAWLALALRDHPIYDERLRTDEAFVDAFVQEVRRYYPFTPLLGARARSTFTWHGANFSEGQLVILDVYGTLRDGRIWDDPNEFRPGRFLSREPTAFDFIPHGGGDFLGGHRCAGEWLTIEAMKQALRFLTTQVSYTVPAQDLSYRLSEIPARPRSGVILREVARLAAPAARLDPSALRGAESGAVAALHSLHAT